MRELRGLPPGQPQPNDKLVCLKNNASKGIFNGEIYFVTELLDPSDNIIRMKIRWNRRPIRYHRQRPTRIL